MELLVVVLSVVGTDNTSEPQTQTLCVCSSGMLSGRGLIGAVNRSASGTPDLQVNNSGPVLQVDSINIQHFGGVSPNPRRVNFGTDTHVAGQPILVIGLV